MDLIEYKVESTLSFVCSLLKIYGITYKILISVPEEIDKLMWYDSNKNVIVVNYDKVTSLIQNQEFSLDELTLAIIHEYRHFLQQQIIKEQLKGREVDSYILKHKFDNYDIFKNRDEYSFQALELDANAFSYAFKDLFLPFVVGENNIYDKSEYYNEFCSLVEGFKRDYFHYYSKN